MIVALVTVHAECPMMNVVGSVAGHACLGFLFLANPAGMTIPAVQILVPSRYWEIGLRVVIEEPGRPSIGVMTDATLVTQRTLVDIVLFVAVTTFLLHVLEIGRNVTSLAGD